MRAVAQVITVTGVAIDVFQGVGPNRNRERLLGRVAGSRIASPASTRATYTSRAMVVIRPSATAPRRIVRPELAAARSVSATSLCAGTSVASGTKTMAAKTRQKQARSLGGLHSRVLQPGLHRHGISFSPSV